MLNLIALLTELNNQDPYYIKPHQAVINQLTVIANKTRLSTCLKEIHYLHAQYIKEIKCINDEYLKQATELQLRGMHQIISRWRLDFHKTRILIAVAEGPQKDLIEGQYIDALYKEKGIIALQNKPYIDYVIMLPTQLGKITGQCLINDLKERLLNQTIAKNMLGCSKKMDRDVLGSYAPAVLRNIFPAYNQSTKIPVSVSKYSFFHNVKKTQVSLPTEPCPHLKRN